MELAPGRRLGPYEVVSRLGAGGMGEVWRGRDTRLDRNVAIKILPPDLASNPQFRSRFEREAKTISQLSHANICTLFDVGREDGVDYLVMELLEGESLADRLAKGPLPLHEVLRVGQQIADALDRAHRQGVVHRDLKPANVMLTKSGAKLLDFGLAKLAQVDVALDDVTQQKPLTREGTIVGTFQYMSPEQLEGLDADSRTDIFSLGAVLYEMATGKRAFEGQTKTSLIAAIVGGQPEPIGHIQPLTPPALEHVIAKCLEKDRDHRWQSAHDIAEELRWISTAGSQAGAAAPVVTKRKRRELALVATIALLAVAVAALAWRAAGTAASGPAYRASLALPSNPGYNAGPPAISPDGTTLAYSATLPNGESTVWLRRFDDMKAAPLEGATGGTAPFWSPDGRHVAFLLRNTLKRVAADGGQADQIVEGAGTRGGSWNRDGIILYSPSQLGPINSVRAAGGEPEQVTDPKALGHTSHMWPYFLPDQRHFLFLALAAEGAKGRPGIWIASLDRSEAPRFVVAADTNAALTRDGYLFFSKDGVLRAQRFDAKRGEVDGDPITITPVQTSMPVGCAYFTVGGDATLVYLESGSEELTEFVWADRQGKRLGAIGQPGYYWSPRLSHDAKLVAADRSDSSGKGDIWLFDTASAATTRLTFDPLNESAPVWGHDDRSIVFFRASGKASRQVMTVGTSGGAARPLTGDELYNAIPTDVSRDGATIVAEVTVTTDRRGQSDIMLLDARKTHAAPYLATPSSESCGRISPDGRWLAYVSDESGRNEVYMQSIPAGGGKWQVSTDGGAQPAWSRDGSEILFVASDSKLMSAAVRLGPDPGVSTPVALFPVSLRDDTLAQFDVTSDGRILLNASVPRKGTPMTLITDWRRLFLKE